MSKPFTNPFLETDMSKLFDMSKISGNFNMPQLNMDAATNLHRKNIEACTALNQAALESFQALWRRQADVARQMMEETAQAMQAIVSCPSPEEKMIKHAEASKATMDKCLANVRDVTETVAKCNVHALETVSTHINESMNELRGTMKGASAAA
ncbi:MAG: phasin family protein [Alphaproteobacteria bacterium]